MISLSVSHSLQTHIHTAISCSACEHAVLQQDPEHPTRDNLVDMDIKSLRDTRVLLDNVRVCKLS